MMKKSIWIILSALLILALCACNQAPADNTDSTPTGQIIGHGGTEDNFFDDVEDEQTVSDPTQTDPQEPSEGTAPEETEESVTDEPDPPVMETDPPAGGVTPNTAMTYEEFNALTPKQKREFQESFGDIEAFFDWYEAVKAKYEEENPPVIIGSDGVIVLP